MTARWTYGNKSPEGWIGSRALPPDPRATSPRLHLPPETLPLPYETTSQYPNRRQPVFVHNHNLLITPIQLPVVPRQQDKYVSIAAVSREIRIPTTGNAKEA